MNRYYKSNKIKQTIKLSKIEYTDIPALLEIEDNAHLEKWGAHGHLAEIERGDSINFLVRDENKIVGFLYARVVGSVEADLLNIGILKEYRKQGLGSKLWENLRDYCTSRGIDSLWLEVRQSNTEAVSFYINRGCEKIQIRKDFYQNPSEDAILMKCLINKTSRNL